LTEPLIVSEYRIPSSRAIIHAQNDDQQWHSILMLKRWMRYLRIVLNADSTDIYLSDHFELLPPLLSSAKEMGMTLGLRTSSMALPAHIASVMDSGLQHIHLDLGQSVRNDHISWKEFSETHSTPLRLTFQAPFPTSTASAEWVEEMVGSSVVSVDFSLKNKSNAGASSLPETMEWLEKVCETLESKNIECNIIDIPFCAVPKTQWKRVHNSPQHRLSHSSYMASSFDLAKTIDSRKPFVGSMIIRVLLSRATLNKEVQDTLMLPWLLRNSYRYLVARIIRRLTIHLRLRKDTPSETSQAAFERELKQKQKSDVAELGKVCSECSLKRICDHETSQTSIDWTGFEATSIEGEHVVSPLHFALEQAKSYSAREHDRLNQINIDEDLAQEAIQFITSHEPDKIVTSADYAIENAHFDRMEGGIKWWSITQSEKLTSELGEFDLPFTLSVDVGGGIADFFGIHLGRQCKILTPMEAYRHNFIFHVNEEGHYILLRDRHPVHPSEFEGELYLPLRVGNRLQPRLSAWNIDNCIATQNLRIWSGPSRKSDAARKVKYSIVIVSTKFTRRLQAVLHNLAHQQDFDLGSIEIIICYVPGLDATDDLIDSFSMTFPDIQIIRSPFPEKYMRSKGFLINESAKLTHGEWIMLLDSDTLLAPDYFSKIEALSDTANFIAPDGRRLLPPDTTGAILMGEIKPWEEWETLLNGNGEFRHRETQGIPVGFCQCFRAKYLEKFPYLEVDHFETADMQFGMEMLKEIGEEHRISGRPVLHLDHGGSQWYGAQKHM